VLNRFMTPGHFKNTAYVTTLNEELRNPQWSHLIRIGASGEKNLGHLSREKVLEESAEITRDKLNAEFKNLIPTLLPHNRYRGVKGLSDVQYAIVKGLKRGDIVEDKGFAYFSNNKNFAKKYANGLNSVFIKCKIPLWSKVSRMLGIMPSMDNYGNILFKSGETLFPAASKWKVLKNHVDKKGVVNLVLKYLK